MTLLEFQFTSTDNLALKVLPLTEDLMVELQEMFLQHMHLFESHFVILGYNLHVLKGICLILEEHKRVVFKGERTTLGPLLKDLLTDANGTRNEADWRFSDLKRTTGWSEEKLVIFFGNCKEDTECILIGEIQTLVFVSRLMIDCFVNSVFNYSDPDKRQTNKLIN